MEKIKVASNLEIYYLFPYDATAKIMIKELKIRNNPFPLQIFLKSKLKEINKLFNKGPLLILYSPNIIKILNQCFSYTKYHIVFDKINYDYKQAYAKDKNLILPKIKFNHEQFKALKSKKTFVIQLLSLMIYEHLVIQ